ncbi:HAD family hydrolase [Bacillus rubiinfantis]|uniref:HAD family hydrolase n=1 Tax=Bacillus rubiinfantis TaxID=1499680 RepID=UPI0005A5FA08|nr:HAD family hydrolase [Bacillus rubiinfantis]
MIKAIFFDLDDTLLWDQKSVKEAFRATCKLANERYGVDPEALETAVRTAAVQLYSSYDFYPFTQMIGINPFEGLWGNFLDEQPGEFTRMKETVPVYRREAWTTGLKELGIDDREFGEELAERFPVERKNLPFVYEDTYEILNTLKDQYQLLLVTNGSPDLQNTKLAISPQLHPYFNHIVISGAFGKGKPDPAIFAYALSLLSLKPDEAIMVGDNLRTDILGANRAGIQSVWINRHNHAGNEVIPTYEIRHLSELNRILAKINRNANQM